MPDATTAVRAAGRIVVFTGSLDYAVRKGIVAIDEAIPGTEWLIVVQQPRRTLQRLLRNQVLNFKRNGWRWIPYQAGELWTRFVGSGMSHEPVRPEPGHDFTRRALEARANVRIEEVEDMHAAAVIDRVSRFAPDLGLSLAAPILKRHLFALPRLGSINLHKGRLPDFRGMPPAFWELWHDQASIGCSVHRVDDKLDAGPLLGETEVRRAAYSTVRSLQLELDEVAIGLVRACAKAVLDGTAVPRTQPSGRGAIYRKPTLAQQAQLKAKLTLPTGAGERVKTALKNVIASGVVGAHRLGLGRLMAPRVTVLLYHRVSDDVRDNLTVGIEQFHRQMEWLATHCHVLSIESVIAMDEVPRERRPLVTVTFDDGYHDNYQYAAPILMRHGLPAAFFVSTGIVDTESAFPHDVLRRNPPIEKMSWDQLGEMRDWGFTIGSHTVSHIDCAAEPEHLVQSELELSRDHLRQKLGIREPILAYPYGGRQHMTDARLELVKAAGYRACLSAYGGVNVARVDPFNVLRRPVNWGFSDRSFQRLCLGLM